MPFPDEHSCRLQDPDQFDSFRRENDAATVDGRQVDFIFGIDESEDESELQAIRYPFRNKWGGNADAAREHCNERDSIMFEPADPDAGEEEEAASARATADHAMRHTKSPGGSTVTTTTHAKDVVTREVDDDEVEMLRVPISSTHQDRDGDAFSKSALHDMAAQIRSERPLVHDDHGRVGGGLFAAYSARETIGTLMDADVVDDENGGDHAVLYGYINPDGTHPDGEGDRMLAQVKEEKQAIKFSVGFGIHKIAEDIPEEDRPDRANEISGRLFMEVDLMETSRVGIPSNPEASAGLELAKSVGEAERIPVALMTPEQVAQVDREVVEAGTPTAVDGDPEYTTNADGEKVINGRLYADEAPDAIRQPGDWAVHTPEFSDTSTAVSEEEWDAHEEAEVVDAFGGEGDESWDDLTDEQKAEAGQLWIASASGFPAENFGDMNFEVVDLSGTLQLGGLRAAESSLSLSDAPDEVLSEVESVIDDLMGEFEDGGEEDSNDHDPHMTNDTGEKAVTSFLTEQFEEEVQSRMEETDMSREEAEQDVEDDLANETNRDPSTIDNILNGDIPCPPIDPVLEGFAAVLDFDVEDAVEADDGECDYDMTEDSHTGTVSEAIDILTDADLSDQEREAAERALESGPDATDAPEYVPREEYEELAAELDEIRDALSDGRGDPETPDTTEPESPVEGTDDTAPDETNANDHETIFD